MNVLKKINKMRLERDWSVYKLSVESGLSQSTITNMFNRETLPSITSLECICKAFGITLAEFFEETTPTQLSDQKVLELYHSINDEAKQSIIALMKELSKK